MLLSEPPWYETRADENRDGAIFVPLGPVIVNIGPKSSGLPIGVEPGSGSPRNRSPVTLYTVHVPGGGSDAIGWKGKTLVPMLNAMEAL